MSDPLRLIGTSGASGAYQPPRPQPQAGAGDGASFKDVLMANIKQVNELQQDASRAIENLQSGQGGDLESVILATQKADTAFRALQAVRNRVIEAYDELRQIRV
jgi:flagellar hook-basal body complex protein FliE